MSWWSFLHLSRRPQASRPDSEEVVHVHERASQEGEDSQLPALCERRSDQKRHRAVHARVDQCPEGTPKEWPALD